MVALITNVKKQSTLKATHRWFFETGLRLFPSDRNLGNILPQHVCQTSSLVGSLLQKFSVSSKVLYFSSLITIFVARFGKTRS